MDLFLITIQTVPMLFIPLFLDRNAANDTPRQNPKNAATLRSFHLAVAVLGLIAFTISVYVVGSENEPEGWMRRVVITALACAMAALSAQILLRLTSSKRKVDA